MARRRLWPLALSALLGLSVGACVSCVSTFVSQAESLAAKVEALLDDGPAAEPGAPWGESTKVVARQVLCQRVYQNKFHGDALCECLVAETSKRVSEAAFQDWLMSDGEAHAGTVERVSAVAESECRARLGSI